MSTTHIDEIGTATTRRWTVDPARSTVEFSVRVWGLGTVNGRFDRVDGSYVRGRGGGKIELTLDARSIDTGSATRDRHLRSGDFFAIDEYPHVRFMSRQVVESGTGVLHIAGSLEAAGKTLPLVFDAAIRDDGDELEIEATATADHIRRGVTPGLLRMIRPPATLHVRMRLV